MIISSVADFITVLGIQVRLGEEDECLSIASNRQGPIPPHDYPTASASHQPTSLHGVPHGCEGEYRPPNRSASIIPQASQQDHTIPQTLSLTSSPLSQFPSNRPNGSFLPMSNASSIHEDPRAYVQRHAVPGPSRSTYQAASDDMMNPPSVHYTMAAGSDESLASTSAPSFVSSSESIASEESRMEQDESSCSGPFLDPSSFAPPNFDHLLAFLATGYQSQYTTGPLPQNVNDIFLAADLDLGSLSEAWT